MIGHLHLSPNHRGVLEAPFREHLPDVEVWAYGSQINGRFPAGGGLNLVLRGPGLKRIPVRRLANFMDAVRDSAIPSLVDVLDWARLPEEFRQGIERN